MTSLGSQALGSCGPGPPKGLDTDSRHGHTLSPLLAFEVYIREEPTRCPWGGGGGGGPPTPKHIYRVLSVVRFGPAFLLRGGAQSNGDF